MKRLNGNPTLKVSPLRSLALCDPGGQEQVPELDGCKKVSIPCGHSFSATFEYQLPVYVGIVPFQSPAAIRSLRLYNSGKNFGDGGKFQSPAAIRSLRRRSGSRSSQGSTPDGFNPLRPFALCDTGSAVMCLCTLRCFNPLRPCALCDAAAEAAHDDSPEKFQSPAAIRSLRRPWRPPPGSGRTASFQSPAAIRSLRCAFDLYMTSVALASAVSIPCGHSFSATFEYQLPVYVGIVPFQSPAAIRSLRLYNSGKNFGDGGKFQSPAAIRSLRHTGRGFPCSDHSLRESFNPLRPFALCDHSSTTAPSRRRSSFNPLRPFAPCDGD